MAEEKKIKQLSKDEAKRLFDKWADHMDLDSDLKWYKDVWEQLRLPIRKHQLLLDMETDTFTLNLKYPVTTDGGNKVSILTIKSCSLDKKRKLQEYGETESVDAARAMLSAYTGQPESVIKEIEDLDISRINGVLCGFITQTGPLKN